MAAVPVPASFALTGAFLARSREWHDIRTNLMSFAVCFAIVTVVHFPFARAARRSREADRQFAEHDPKT
jgi:hypothetical protein